MLAMMTMKGLFKGFIMTCASVYSMCQSGSAILRSFALAVRNIPKPILGITRSLVVR
jgi:hypothetical protein